MLEQERIFVANQKDFLDDSSQPLQFLDYLGGKIKAGEVSLSNKKIIFCPSYIHLPLCYQYIQRVNLSTSIFLGVQDVSQFDKRQNTGEIPATQIKEFASYAILHHSERIKIGETNEQGFAKNDQARRAGLKVIYCVQDENQKAPENSECIAYEPPAAIGAEKTDSQDNIQRVLGVLNQKYPQSALLYGGTVNPDTVSNLIKIPKLQGFLIGRASIDPQSFVRLLTSC